jgi:RHS repeat-associated protein
MAEERDVSNAVTKRFFALGEQIGSSSYYYTRDHLGSVREMSDSSGNIQARYDYDPYGRVAKISGSMDSDSQYAGYYEHATSGLNLTLFRAYDPNTAKWLSRDPLPDAERRLGPNLYEYVKNNPVDWTDPLGLAGGGHGSGYNRGPANSSGNRCPSDSEKLEGDIVGLDSWGFLLPRLPLNFTMPPPMPQMLMLQMTLLRKLHRTPLQIKKAFGGTRILIQVLRVHRLTGARQVLFHLLQVEEDVEESPLILRGISQRSYHE